MKKDKKTIVIALSAVIVAFAFLVFSYLGGREKIVSYTAEYICAPFYRGISIGAGWLEKLYGYIYKFDSIEAENAELKIKIAQMEEENRRSNSVIAENENLKKLLKLSDSHKDFVYESAGIISVGASNWSSSFTINKGENSGVEEGDCVITAEGFFVGQVSEVGSISATVRTLIDTESSFGAIISRSGAPAVACGEFTLMKKGLLKLDYISEESIVLNGDTVLTSGSGILPPDIVVGRVESVEIDVSGLSSYAVLSPAADLTALSQVFVIKDFEIVQ